MCTVWRKMAGTPPFSKFEKKKIVRNLERMQAERDGCQKKRERWKERHRKGERSNCVKSKA